MRFNLLALFTAGIAAVSACQHPRGSPRGNPIRTPGLGQIVHKGEPFKITWDPTTPVDETISIVLLRGPSTNLHKLHRIAKNIKNHGHFTWTPGDHLEVDDTHYGLQLIVDRTCQYQYSTQFGIGHKRHHAGSDADLEVNAARLTTAGGSYPQHATTPAVVYSTEVVSEYTTYCPSATSVTMGNNTYTVTSATSLTITDCPCTITHTPGPYHPPSNTTYTPHQNTTMTHKTSINHTPYHPTQHTTPYAPSSPAPTMHAPTSPAAAGHVAASFGAVGVAGFVLAVFGL